MSHSYKHIIHFKSGDMVFCLVKNGIIKRVGHPAFERFIGRAPAILDAWWKSNDTREIEKPISLNEQSKEMERLEFEQHSRAQQAPEGVHDAMRPEDYPTEMPKSVQNV